MQFIPSESIAQDVPYFEDVTSADGWQGHSTSKSMQTLKSEISQGISRLGGMVIRFQSGDYLIDGKSRQGFRVYYVIDDGAVALPGQMDIAALPVRDTARQRKSYKTRQEKSLKMALYMLRNALDGLWFLQQLSPGYASLMPWMIEQNSGKTITQLWSETTQIAQLIPPSDGEFIMDAEIEHID